MPRQKAGLHSPKVQNGGQRPCKVCQSSCNKSRLMQLVCNNLCIIYREGNEAFVDDDYELAVKVGISLFA